MRGELLLFLLLCMLYFSPRHQVKAQTIGLKAYHLLSPREVPRILQNIPDEQIRMRIYSLPFMDAESAYIEALQIKQILMPTTDVSEEEQFKRIFFRMHKKAMEFSVLVDDLEELMVPDDGEYIVDTALTLPRLFWPDRSPKKGGSAGSYLQRIKNKERRRRGEI